MTETFDYRRILNRSRYPIDEPDNPRRGEIIGRVRAGLSADGCAVIRDFLSADGLADLLAEAEARKAGAYYSPHKTNNVYLNDGDPGLPADHPRNRLLPRSNGFVTADSFNEDTLSRRFYYWPALIEFIADCLGKTRLYIYQDPVSNMIVNVNKPGQQFNWHFDTNEFTITLLLRAASDGGVFEYVPALRSAEDECYPAVRAVLDGDRSRVRSLQLNPGDLQLFLGRFSLHRVTENTGDGDRLLLILSFAETPNMIGSAARVQKLYGKVTAAHHGQRQRTDGLAD